MRLTKQSSYAVRALMYCAANDGALCRVSDIARAYSISEMFLFKLIKPLVENGMLETLRGRNGGIRLARPAKDINLLEVIQLTEDSFALAECFESSDIGCPLVMNCEFNRALNGALDSFFSSLAGHTIADLVAQRRSVRDRLGLTEAPEGSPA